MRRSLPKRDGRSSARSVSGVKRKASFTTGCYAHQAWPQVFRVQIRPAVRRGDPLPFYLWQGAGRVAPQSVLRLETGDPILGWAGRPPPPPPPHRYRNLEQIRGYGGSDFGFGSPLAPADLPPGLIDGPQGVHLMAPVRIGTVGVRDEFHPLDTGTVDLPATFTLAPAEHPTVQLVRNPTLADMIRRAIHLGFMHDRDLELSVDGTPVGLSFAVFLRRPGQPDVPVGTLARSAALPASTLHTGVDHWPTLPHGTAVTVVFRADPAPAVDTVDVTTAWAGELIFPGVVIP